MDIRAEQSPGGYITEYNELNKKKNSKFERAKKTKQAT